MDLVSSFAVLIVFIVVLVFLFKPFAGLIIAMFLMYNPIYEYFVINLQGFEEAKIRVLASLVSILFLASAVVFRLIINTKMTRAKTPLDKPLFIMVPFLIISSIIGILRGNPMHEIASAVFPFIEGLSFFF